MVKIRPPVCLPAPTTRIMIWTKLHLHFLRIFPNKLQIFWPNGLWKGDILKGLFFIYAYSQFRTLPTIEAQPYLRGSWFEKKKLNLPYLRMLPYKFQSQLFCHMAIREEYFFLNSNNHLSIILNYCLLNEGVAFYFKKL